VCEEEYGWGNNEETFYGVFIFAVVKHKRHGFAPLL
jgi:hypothetical protein